MTTCLRCRSRADRVGVFAGEIQVEPLVGGEIADDDHHRTRPAAVPLTNRAEPTFSRPACCGSRRPSPAGRSADMPVAMSGIIARTRKSPTMVWRYQFSHVVDVVQDGAGHADAGGAARKSTPTVSVDRPRWRRIWRWARSASTRSSGPEHPDHDQRKAAQHRGHQQHDADQQHDGRETAISTGSQPRMQAARMQPLISGDRPTGDRGLVRGRLRCPRRGSVRMPFQRRQAAGTVGRDGGPQKRDAEAQDGRQPKRRQARPGPAGSEASRTRSSATISRWPPPSPTRMPSTTPTDGQDEALAAHAARRSGSGWPRSPA